MDLRLLYHEAARLGLERTAAYIMAAHHQRHPDNRRFYLFHALAHVQNADRLKSRIEDAMAKATSEANRRQLAINREALA